MTKLKLNLRQICKDLVFSNCSDSDEISTKDYLASRINRLIDYWEMSQTGTADFLEISQSRVSALRNGRLTDFTIEHLYSLLKKLDCQVENRLLEEYEELGLCWRHDDNWISKLGAVLLPLSIASLTIPYLRAGTPKLLAVVGGLTLITYWYLSSSICKGRFEIRFSRIHEIERILGLDSHLRYDRESAKKTFKHQRLRCAMFVGYLVIALLVACDIKIESTSPTMAHRLGQFIRALSDTRVETALGAIDVWATNEWSIKLVFTVETIIVATIVLFGLDIYICMCTWGCAGKRSILKLLVIPKPPPKLVPWKIQLRSE